MHDHVLKNDESDDDDGICRYINVHQLPIHAAYVSTVTRLMTCMWLSAKSLFEYVTMTTSF